MRTIITSYCVSIYESMCVICKCMVILMILLWGDKTASFTALLRDYQAWVVLDLAYF